MRYFTKFCRCRSSRFGVRWWSQKFGDAGTPPCDLGMSNP